MLLRASVPKLMSGPRNLTSKNSKRMGNKLTSGKARKILSDNSVRGHKLTRKQQKFFGAISGGATPRNPSPPFGKNGRYSAAGKLGIGS